MPALDHLKVYSPDCTAVDWGFGYDQIVDLDTALAQPTKIAAVPVYCNDPGDFAYRPEFLHLDLSQFDLVLFTDIQFRSQTQLIAWIQSTGAQTWLLSVAGLWPCESIQPNVIYRPTWMFTFLRWNPPRDDFPMQRDFLFDCLCGTRRVHRDYIMLSLQTSGLLTKGIATYRDIFPGREFDQTPRHIQEHFRDTQILWPYVSPDLKPEWEVRTELDNSISSIVPWEIYNRTWFTILLETNGVGNIFLAAEKIGKCLYARRLFVHVGNANWLSRLRSLGFETFGSVLDEGYDDMLIDIDRWHAAFEQIQWLSTQNMPAIIQKIRPILDHNRQRLYQYKQEIFDRMATMILDHVK